jgi:hypothetical protein
MDTVSPIAESSSSNVPDTRSEGSPRLCASKESTGVPVAGVCLKRGQLKKKAYVNPATGGQQ